MYVRIPSNNTLVWGMSFIEIVLYSEGPFSEVSVYTDTDKSLLYS